MVKRGTRKARQGLIEYIYNPISQAIRAVNNATTTTTKTVGKVVHNSLSGVNTIGKKVTKRANNTLKGLVPKNLVARLTRRKQRANRK
jgi:hypothetical protein